MTVLPKTLAVALPWPLPALLCWAAGWAVAALLQRAGAGAVAAFAAGAVAALLAACACSSARRRMIAAAGFPLSSLLFVSAAALPAVVWLALLLPLLAVYPLRAWRDAPFFPTPAAALAGLQDVLPAPCSVLDAGCGVGHGLAALRALWPQARLHGVEWSVPLAWAAAWRCTSARVRRGDMWAASWAAHDLVYVFQRPENMARVYDKAACEMAIGTWLVSLEFAVPQRAPHAVLRGAGRRPVWVYRIAAGDGGSTTGEPGR